MPIVALGKAQSGGPATARLPVPGAGLSAPWVWWHQVEEVFKVSLEIFMTSCEPGSHLPSGADLSTEAQRCQLICPHEELENVVINLSQLPFYYPLGPPVKPSLGSVWLLVGSMDEAKGSVRFLLHPDPGEPGRMKSWQPPGGA